MERQTGDLVVAAEITGKSYSYVAKVAVGKRKSKLISEALSAIAENRNRLLARKNLP